MRFRDSALLLSLVPSANVKYKLDGPPSKVRVQEPWEKAFVLLQSSIGGLNLDDFSLRKEMNSTVEYASRMLSAIEEYSLRGSKNGQVAVQALRLRRSLSTSLWNARDGALNQIMGIGPKTTASLKMNGIISFEDALASEASAIERAAQRPPPFGKNLRSVATKILQGALKLSATLEYAAGSTTPCTIVCRLDTLDDVPRCDRGSCSTAPAVTYTLISYTEKPGGLLLHKRDISKAQIFKADTPPTFSEIFVVLIATLNGLDGKPIINFVQAGHCPRNKVETNSVYTFASHRNRKGPGT